MQKHIAQELIYGRLGASLQNWPKNVLYFQEIRRSIKSSKFSKA